MKRIPSPVRFLVLLCALLPATELLSQDVLESVAKPADEVIQVPDPAQLGVGWWAYLGDGNDQLQARVDALKSKIDESVLALSVADSPAAVEAAERAKREIDGYLTALGQRPTVTPLVIRTTGSFSLDDYLAVRQRLREAGIERLQETASLDEFNELSLIERRNVDQIMKQYLALQDDVQRIIEGLRIIADRAVLAVSQLQLSRKEAEIDRLDNRINALEEQAIYARRNLSVEGWDLEAAENRLAEQGELLVDLQAATRAARGSMLDVDSTSEDAKIRGDYSRQKLIAAYLNENGALLERERLRAQIAWHGLFAAESSGDVDQLTALLEDLRTSSGQFNNSVAGWQRTSESLLLNPDVSVTRDRELLMLRGRSRELGTENLLKLRTLSLEYGDLDELSKLLTAEIASREGGFKGAWRSMRLVAGEYWEDVYRLADSALFHFGDIPVTPLALLRLILIFVSALLISALFRRGLERLGERKHVRDQSSLYLFGRVAHYLFIVAAIMFGLSTLGFDFTSVALVAGALSVGIGFGLQNVVNNFVSGLILMFERSLKIGDYIELDSGVTGTVREINVRSTRINTNDNVDVLVPNSEFFNTRLVNWTHRDALARIRIPFGVAYGSDKETVKEAALKAADSVEYTLKHMPGKEPIVFMKGFGDSSLDFLLLIWVSRKGVRRPTRVRSAYFWALETELRNAGIEIPFPQRDLHVRSGLHAPEGSAGTE